MAENKTKPSDESVLTYLATLANPRQQEEAMTLLALFEDVTGEPAVLWGTMVGFSRYQYTYKTGHGGESFVMGFAPRTGKFSLYIMTHHEMYQDFLSRLGKHKVSKACLYVNKLADIDLGVLKELMQEALARNDIYGTAE